MAMGLYLFFRKYFTVSLLMVPLLISIIILLRQGNDSETIAEAAVPQKEMAPLLTGGRMSFWEPGRRFCTLEMHQIVLVPKRWGPFNWADSRDILIKDCSLKIDNDALTSSLEEIGITLLNLARIGSATTQARGNSLRLESGTVPPLISISLPPKVEATPFSCEMRHPQGQTLTLKAALATFDPPQPLYSLEGNVQVISSDGTSLYAEALDWDPVGEQVWVTGAHEFNSQKTRRQGKDGHFTLAKGLIKPLPPGGKEPSLADALPPFPPNPLAWALTSRVPKEGDNHILPLLCQAVAQAQAANSPGKEVNGPLPLPLPVPLPVSP